MSHKHDAKQENEAWIRFLSGRRKWSQGPDEVFPGIRSRSNCLGNETYNRFPEPALRLSGREPNESTPAPKTIRIVPSNRNVTPTRFAAGGTRLWPEPPPGAGDSDAPTALFVTAIGGQLLGERVLA